MFGHSRVDSFKLDPSEKQKDIPPLSAMDLANRNTVEKKVQYKCRVFNLTDPTDRDDFEDLMTKMCNGDDSVEYHHEQASFGRDGDYLVAFRWFEREEA